jgi:hypothetical protein
MNQDFVKADIVDLIKQVYAVLEFSPSQIDAALDDFYGINQSAVAAQMVTDFTPKEVEELNKCLSPEFAGNRQEKLGEIVKSHFSNTNFAAKAGEATDKAWREYAAYLKTLGNDSQKEKISQILASI